MEPCLGNLSWFGQELGQKEEFRSPVLVDWFHFFSTVPCNCVVCRIYYTIWSLENISGSDVRN